MQRRHAIIAAIALVALVLIPAAVLASGPGGFGHREAGPGPKNVSQADGIWAGNATHPNWSAVDGPGNRTCHADATCAANLSCDRDPDAPGDSGTVTSPAFDRDRPRFGNRTAANQTGTDETGRPFGSVGRAHRGQGR